MVESINKVVLLGAIGKHGVQLKYAPSGSACASFLLITTKQKPDGTYFSTLIDCEVWGKRAESVSELEPGTLVFFEGEVGRRKKGEAWHQVITGFDASPFLVPTGVTGEG